MPDDMMETNFAALDTLLEEERAALLGGQLEKLTDMLPS